MKKRILTAEEAISILPDGDSVHTFVNGGFGLMGADLDREDIIDKIRGSDRREVTGPMARGMNHGRVLYPPNTKYQSDLLFVETDKKRLDEIDPPEEEK